MESVGNGAHILILVENLPVPFDRRVWQEARALRDDGYEVSVICPATEDYPIAWRTIEGIRVCRHPLYEAKGKPGYFLEYPMALFFQWWLSVSLFLRSPFEVVHACNPPDLLWLVAAPYKLFGVRFVFDHHDLNPELFETKFGSRGLLYSLLCWLEAVSFRMADKSIATNQSYKRVAVERGSMDPEDVVVVRSAPDIDYFDQLRNHVERRETESVKVGYVGVMGEQEGLDLLLEAVKIVREHRRDIQFTLIGDGPAAADVKALARQYNLHDVVEFTGRISDRAMISELAGADICVNPDRATPMNDKSTMNKIMEYMALGKPIVQFDRTEGRFSAGEASLYARKDDPEDFAKKIMVLADDPDRRQKMGRKGRRRLEEQLSWKHQKDALLALYRELLN